VVRERDHPIVNARQAQPATLSVRLATLLLQSQPAGVCGRLWPCLGARPVLELLGWGLHILIDIPTHRGIFAVHFLWPLSSFGFEGIRWESPWFLTVNYGALMMLFGWMWLSRRKTDLAVLGHRGTQVEGKIRAPGS
jgi:hypothetical protein